MLNKKINIVFILFLNRPFLLADPLPVDEEATLVEIPLCSPEMTAAECSKGMFDRIRWRILVTDSSVILIADFSRGHE